MLIVDTKYNFSMPDHHKLNKTGVENESNHRDIIKAQVGAGI